MTLTARVGCPRRCGSRAASGTGVSNAEHWQVQGREAELYQRHLVPAVTALWAAELVERVDVRAGERVLDIACGTGVVARAAAERAGPDGNVTGLDINPAMLGVARGESPASRLRPGQRARPALRRREPRRGAVPARAPVLPRSRQGAGPDAPRPRRRRPARPERVRPDRAQPGHACPRPGTRSPPRDGRVTDQARRARARLRRPGAEARDRGWIPRHHDHHRDEAGPVPLRRRSGCRSS